jgi:hypothetical protein
MTWSNTSTSKPSAPGSSLGGGSHSSIVAPSSSMSMSKPQQSGINSMIPIVPSANQEIEKQKVKLQQKHFRSAPRAGSGYVCRRCQGTDHYLENCPTNGNPAYDKLKTAPGAGQSVTMYNSSQPTDVIAAETKQLHGVPLAARNRVADLEGIDTTGKVVIFHKESNSYEILESHNAGLKKLIKEG